MQKLFTKFLALDTKSQIVVVILLILAFLLLRYIVKNQSEKLKVLWFKLNNPPNATDGTAENEITEARKTILNSIADQFKTSIECYFCDKDEFFDALTKFNALPENEAIYLDRRFKNIAGYTLYEGINGETCTSAWSFIGMANQASGCKAQTTALSRLSSLNLSM